MKRANSTRGVRSVLRRPLWALMIALLAVSAAASAQSDDAPGPADPGPIATDRPTTSFSPFVVPRGVFQFELGYRFTNTERNSSTSDVQVFPDLLARFGVGKTFELRLGFDGWTRTDTATGNTTGFSDIAVSSKINLTDARGARPAMGLLIDVSLPVGDTNVTSNHVIPKVLFLAINSLGENLSLTYNFGPSFVTRDTNDGSESFVDFNYAVALGGSVGGGVGLFGELYGAWSTSSNTPDRHSIQAGTTIPLSRVFQIDLRAGAGLVNNEPDWLVGAGLAFRVD